MSNSQQERTNGSDDAVLKQSLSDADAIVSEFERHLEGELQLLKTGRSEGLEAIAVAKQTLVEKINSEESMFTGLFQQYGSDEEVIDLKNRLAQCRINNRNNHALVMMELKHANKSLELLRSVLNMDDLSLYSDRGEVQVNREKRRFGSA